MQATGPPLPELDAFGQQTVAPPMRRAMWRLVMTAGDSPLARAVLTKSAPDTSSIEARIMRA